MPHPDWNDSYKTGELPWDTGKPDRHLVAASGEDPRRVDDQPLGAAHAEPWANEGDPESHGLQYDKPPARPHACYPSSAKCASCSFNPLCNRRAEATASRPG